MYETSAEIAELQLLLDRSIEHAKSPMLRRIFRTHLNARQLVRLMQDVRQVALATSDASGTPRVAPVDALLFHGKFYFSTDASTARARDLRRRSELSLTHFEGDDLAIIVHGSGVRLEPNQPEFRAIDNELKKIIGMGMEEITKEFGGTGGLWIRIEPRAIFTFARSPDRFME